MYIYIYIFIYLYIYIYISFIDICIYTILYIYTFHTILQPPHTSTNPTELSTGGGHLGAAQALGEVDQGTGEELQQAPREGGVRGQLLPWQKSVKNSGRKPYPESPKLVNLLI